MKNIKKFLSLYGFTFMTPVECTDGVTREIYKFTNGEEQMGIGAAIVGSAIIGGASSRNAAKKKRLSN